MIALNYPFLESDIRKLRVGDVVQLSGTIWTGRDRLHHYFAQGGNFPIDFHNGALYHCGPVVLPQGDGWRMVACGPTTSCRENVYEPDFIRKMGVRLIIGKGGMNQAVSAALQECGGCYLQAVGGAAAILASKVEKISNVYFLDSFGASEACWELQVKDFPCVVAMDSYGASLFEEVRIASEKRFQELLNSK